MAGLLFWDIVEHPFCTVLIVLLSWFWVLALYNDLDTRKYAMSVHDCLVKKEYWRIITSPFLHVSAGHLFLDLSCIWNLRYTEANYGSWFMVKYSLIFVVCEAAITQSIIRTAAKFIDNPILTEMLLRLQYHGTSSIILAWLAFQSVEVMNEKTNAIFMLFGLLSIPSAFAPVILIGFYYLFGPRNNGIPNSAGIFVGYLLGIGLIRVLDSPYWTFFIVFDLVIFLFLSTVGTANTIANPLNVGVETVTQQTIPARYYQDRQDAEFLESNIMEGEQVTTSENVGGVEMRDLSSHGYDVESKTGEEGKEEDSLEPLLSDNRGARNRDTYSSMSWSQSWPFRRSNPSNTNAGLGNNSPMGMATSATGPRRPVGVSSVPHRLLVNEDDNV